MPSTVSPICMAAMVNMDASRKLLNALLVKYEFLISIYLS